jgi:hypothetical protein
MPLIATRPTSSPGAIAWACWVGAHQATCRCAGRPARSRRTACRAVALPSTSACSRSRLEIIRQGIITRGVSTASRPAGIDGRCSSPSCRGPLRFRRWARSSQSSPYVTTMRSGAAEARLDELLGGPEPLRRSLGLRLHELVVVQPSIAQSGQVRTLRGPTTRMLHPAATRRRRAGTKRRPSQTDGCG